MDGLARIQPDGSTLATASSDYDAAQLWNMGVGSDIVDVVATGPKGKPSATGGVERDRSVMEGGGAPAGRHAFEQRKPS